MSRPSSFYPLTCLVILLATGCEVGPNYQAPPVVADLPHDWHWKKADPKDAASKGNWWEVFEDSNLDRLEQQAVTQNSDLRAAVARVDRARAQARLRGASFFPTVSLDPSYTRQQIPKDDPQFSIIPIPGVQRRYLPYNSFTVPLDASYELDLWGKVRRSFEASQAQAQSSLADYENIQLTMTADVATDYFTIQEYDLEIEILNKTAQDRALALKLNRTRVQAGLATSVDISQAETDLANAQAELASVQRNRAETQNALAVLCGVMPSDFLAGRHPLDRLPPRVPVGLPASILERRPDVAESERDMAATNAQIGVAYAAFFPSVSLTGQGGFLSASASDLFSWPNSIWSYGPTIRFPIFQGGANMANLKTARANYDEAVANYRTAVLTAVRDVENALADLRFLGQQREALARSVESATRATELVRHRFQVGQTDYTEVTISEETELQADRNLAQVKGQQLYATVRLIKAFGGGWDSAQLKEEEPAPIPFDSEAKLPTKPLDH